MSTNIDALSRATRHHQAGQLAEAERLYRQILAREPNHAQTLHQLGTLTIQLGQLPAAIELFNAAIRYDASRADSHANLAEIYRQLGDFPRATTHAVQAIKLYPNLTAAYAILAEIQKQQGDRVAAVAALREAVRIEPENADLRGLLGELLFELGRMADAEVCFRRAVRIAPDSAVALSNLGSVLAARGEYDEALPLCQRASRLDPSLEAAFYNTGTTLHNLRRFEEATAAFRRVIELNPTSARYHRRLATSLHSQGRADEAIDALREAVRLEPRQGETRCDLGILLGEQGRYGESLSSFREACQIDPKSSRAFYYAGCTLYHLDRFDEAIPELGRSLLLAPESADAEMQLGNCCQALGRMTEAIAHYRRAIELKPQHAAAHSDLIYALNFHPDYDPPAIFAEHLEWGRRHADPLTALAPPHPNNRNPQRRLRVGYVSAHFCDHAVNFFTEPMLTAHDHATCEVYCYSDVNHDDHVTDRLKQSADHWRTIRGWSDSDVDALVRRDEIDILVDLAGHIAGGRPLVFARKPAPVQVSYIGYQNTTGMRAMDYRLTDAWSDPPGTTDSLYTEKLVRLEPTFFCYQPGAEPTVPEPPVVANGFVTFGSFNNFAKVTPQVLELWARIVQSVTRSKLLLLTPRSDGLRRDVLETFARWGVGPERIELVYRSPRGEYLSRIGQVDVALDPFPFNGHTTTCDTLWMGVPVVMMAGRTYVSRFGSSALSTLGLTDWVARTPEDYAEIAVRLAGSIERLRDWRQSLRPRMQRSPLGDATRFTRSVEAAYRQMWVAWCGTGETPEASGP